MSTLQTDKFYKPDKPGLGFYAPFVIAAILIGAIWVLMDRDSKSGILDPFISNKSNLTPVELSKKTITLFAISTDNDDKFHQDERTLAGLETVREMARAVIENLIEWDIPGEPLIFQGKVTISDVFIDQQNFLYIDLEMDEKFLSLGGVSSEIRAINSVCETIRRNFSSIKGVQFLMNGKELDTLAGHVDCSEVFLWVEAASLE